MEKHNWTQRPIFRDLARLKRKKEIEHLKRLNKADLPVPKCVELVDQKFYPYASAETYWEPFKNPFC